jgi:hypothetical protein
MARLSAAFTFLPAALAGLAAAGCGDSAGGRQAVSGTVIFRGNPLDQGNIMFMLVSSEVPTRAGAGITNGKYEIAQMQGLVPGKYRVSISSGDGKNPDGAADTLPGPSGNFSSKERIPRRYNIDSKFAVEVTREGPNKFDFNVP